jgi:molecular chaperone GrpE
MREALAAVERSEGATEPPAASGGMPAAVLADLENQIAELKDRNVRTLADFENFRKRVERERAEQRRYAGFEVLVELLPILDNLGLALDASGDVEDLKVGVELIAKQFHDFLRRHGVERIGAAGETFDPTVHDAVSRDQDPEVEVAMVAEELRPGYRMGDRLLRPASVRVTTPVDGPLGEAPDPADLN